MIYDTDEEEQAKRYFDFANDVVGMLAVSLAATALQFERPAPFATIFGAILLLWMVSKRREFGRGLRDHMNRYRGILFVLLLWRTKIYLIGFVALWLEALGFLTKERIYALLPY